jgi:2-succinyl-6-hydroxy-2,4-cyclohexadiene-1-carboxylate synthase
MRCALIHGFAGDPANWDAVIDAWQLPIPPRAIALPGHVGGGPVRHSWAANLDAIAAAVVGCECVVGYSLGARVALGLLATGRVAFGVLIGVNPGIADAERAGRLQFDSAWARMLRDDGLAAFIAAWEQQPLFASQASADPSHLAERRARRQGLDPELLAQSLEHMGLGAMPNYWSVISAHRDRIALITGEADVKYRAIAEGLPAKRFETIANCGHDPTLEQPAALAAAIARAVAVLAE